MPRYKVMVKQIYIQPVMVEAESEFEAIYNLFNEKCDFKMNEDPQFLINVDPMSWEVEKIEEK